ncbi:hypothetical protein FRC00_012180 [Tulasnella sp. 408]|nr:hypothetical protein FRC00_012180 [Tulasnella sp. 408]
MNSLPVELLSSIFINVLPRDLDDVRYQVDDQAQIQATICCVCERWNRIAKSTPGLWTFIKLSYRAKSHDAMRRRLGLSGDLPLNISMRLHCNVWVHGDEDREWDYEGVWQDPSSDKMLALLVEQVSRWKTLRIYAITSAPSQLRDWIPPQLPNVVALSLRLVVFEWIPVGDTCSREPFISAPRLTFCTSDSPVTFPLTYCPLLKEYHTSGIGLNQLLVSSRTALWRELIAMLSENCPQLEVLQVKMHSGYIPSLTDDASQGDWPVLPSLTTLRFADGTSSANIRCILSELKAPHLRRVEFRDVLGVSTSIPAIRFPVENEGRVLISAMSPEHVTILLGKLENAPDLEIDLDLDSIVDGDPRLREAERWGPSRSLTTISQLRNWWKSVPQDIPKVSWVVPFGEVEASWERIGGTKLSFEEAIAYLDRRREVWLNT